MGSSPTRRHVRVTDPGFRRCESQKVGYRTRSEALDGAEQSMLRDKVRPGCHLTPYRCDRCGEWHIANRVIVKVR